MNDKFITIKDNVSSEIVIKKSRFICNMCRATNEQEANDFIEKIKKQHYNAKHNCSAYIIRSNDLVMRSSDDGEPSGTAGKPMLEILKGSELCNVCAVVTRYFGGVLLGTGGLVRAYSDAVKQAIQKAQRINCVNCSEIEIKCNYNTFPKIQNYIHKECIKVVDTIYEDNVICRFMVIKHLANNIINELVDLSRGNLDVSIVKESWQLIQ